MKESKHGWLEPTTTASNALPTHPFTTQMKKWEREKRRKTKHISLFTSRKLARSIFPSSTKKTCSGILSLKYHTGCWLFFTATCSVEFGAPGEIFWNGTICRSVLADAPSCNGGTLIIEIHQAQSSKTKLKGYCYSLLTTNQCGTLSGSPAARPNVFLLNWIINPSRTPWVPFSKEIS